MTPEQKAAYINAQVTAANCAMQGMMAENQHRLNRGLAVAYDEQAFATIPAEYGIHHNQVIEFFRD